MVNFSSAITLAFFASASVALPWNLQPINGAPGAALPTGGLPAPTGGSFPGLNKRWDLVPTGGSGPAPTGGLFKRWNLIPTGGSGEHFPAPTGGLNKRWNLVPTGAGSFPGPTGVSGSMKRSEGAPEAPAQFGGARHAGDKPFFPVPMPAGEGIQGWPAPTATGGAPFPTAS